MFWKTTLNNLDKSLNKMFAKIGTDIGTIQGEIENIKQITKINYESIDERITNWTIDGNSEHARLDGKIDKETKEINEKIEAIIECLRTDRKDLNILIQMVKKIETKRKK